MALNHGLCAGVYTPMLAERMLARLPHINVVGMAVGNGCWGNAVGLCSDSGDSMAIATQFFHSHSMFDDALWEEMQEHCDWYNVSDACGARVHEMRRQMGVFNLYNVYDNCGMDLVGTPLRLAARYRTTAVELKYIGQLRLPQIYLW